jgi:hypothetical protein
LRYQGIKKPLRVRTETMLPLRLRMTS